MAQNQGLLLFILEIAQDGKTSKIELLLLLNLNIFFTSAFPKFKKTQQHLETISLNSPTILHLLVLFCSC